MTDPDTMTIPELAQRLQISTSKAYELAQADDLPVPVIRIGRVVRVSRTAYQKWISQYNNDPPPDSRKGISTHGRSYHALPHKEYTT